MNKEIEVFEGEIIKIFTPQTVDIKKLADECKGLKINGVEDEEGYEIVFEALQKLKKARTDLTKFAKSLRDEYTVKNRKIREIEKDYLEILQPVEDELKNQRERIDEMKKIEERKILLPSRIKMLDEIGIKLLDAEILRMDEKEFSIYYTEKKNEFDEEKKRIELEKELEIKREAEIKEREKEAARLAKEEAERKAKEEIDRIKKEAEEKEAFRIEKERLAKEEAERIEKEIEEKRKKDEKNKKFTQWKEELKLTEDDKIERIGDKFIAYKKVGEITII